MIFWLTVIKTKFEDNFDIKFPISLQPSGTHCFYRVKVLSKPE